MVQVVVLAAPDSWVRIGMNLAQAGNVDEQPVAHIDPSRIDDIHAIATLALPDPGIDVDEVIAVDLAVG